MKIRKQGFSLVEVTLAVGVTGLGLISLLGLMPQGLNMTRESGNSMAELRIVQQLTGELRSLEWTTVTGQGAVDMSADNRFFDDQAIEVPKESGDLATRLSYVARMQLATDAVKMPGESKDNVAMKKVVIKVANVVDSSFGFSDQDARKYKSFTVLIPQATPDF